MKKWISIVLVCLLLISVFFIGKRLGAGENAAAVAEAALPEHAAERKLRLWVTYDKDADLTTIPLEQGKYKQVQYSDFSKVTIDIDGTRMDLKDALQGGYITVDEMIAYARQDASLGLCGEVATSKNGLTEFTYYYHEFRLYDVYDIYETPDGEQRLISGFCIYGPGGSARFRPEVDGETREILDLEDWGLEFELSGADASGVTVRCSQSGGQQIGELNANTQLLYRKNPNTLDWEEVEPLDPEAVRDIFWEFGDWEPDPDAFLTMGGTRELSFDLARLYGGLPAGDYALCVQIVDCYDPEDVHPLMRNFYDAQWYSIEFIME